MDGRSLPVAVLDGAEPGDEAWSTALARATAVLGSGGTVVMPTDTVYGVAALPTVTGATDELFALKDRAGHQPLAVLVADATQALGLVAEPSPHVRRWMTELWPGPLTLVLPRRATSAHLALGGDDATVGVRCPAHRFVRALAEVVGPIATTSANRHGEPTPTTAVAAASSLVGAVGLVIDGGASGTVASTVVDATTDPWQVLRRGAVGPSALERSAARDG